jgi:F0F1-type ATP synthase assembly protein I
MSDVDSTDEETTFTLYFGSIFAVIMGLVLIVFSFNTFSAIVGLAFALFGGAMLWWLIRDGRQRRKEKAAQGHGDD